MLEGLEGWKGADWRREKNTLANHNAKHTEVTLLGTPSAVM